MRGSKDTTPWPASRIVRLIGLSLVVLMSGISVALLFKDRASAIDAQQKRNALYARVLEDHVTRSIDTAAISLASVASDLSVPLTATSDAVSANLRQLVLSLPQLRGMAVVGMNGVVTAASSSDDVGRRIDLSRLGPLPSNGSDALGSYVPERGLAALAVSAGTPPSPPSVGFLPLMRRVPLAAGDVIVLALIHPDGLMRQMRLTIDDPDSRAALVGYDGRLYGDTGATAPGLLLRAHPVFQRFLPRIEHGNYQEAGIDPNVQTGAFRVSSSRPLVVLVERPLQAVTTDWFMSARIRMIVILVASLTLVGLTLTASRSLNAREEARQRVEAMQLKIIRSEQELNVIVRSVQELLFRTDAHGRLTFVNAHWMAATGESQASIIGTRLVDLVAPEEQLIVQAMLDREASRGARAATLTFWAGTDHPRRVDIALVPLHDGKQATGFAGSAVDITAREEAEAQLAEQLAFVALLLDMSPLPMSMRDMSGRYLDVNRAWLEFTGRTKIDVIGERGEQFIPDAEARLHEGYDQQLQSSGVQLQYEALHTRPDGLKRDLLINKVLVIGRDGKAQGILSTFMDVTELRNAARVTQEAREVAEEASRAKSEFIANISHELRTPLQSIIGFSELGAGRVRNDGMVAGMFTDILTSGQRMLALVNDLLDVAKIDSAVGTIHLERTDLRPLLRTVVQELGPLLGAKQLTIDMQLPTTALSAKVDPFRFQQVVRNVLANAIRFSPTGESIEVGAQTASDGTLHLWFRDRGPGIPPDEFEDIFDAFVQSSKTKGSGGTGLGLAICRKILDAHRGTISASNAKDGGARFDVLLPANEFSETASGALTALG